MEMLLLGGSEESGGNRGVTWTEDPSVTSLSPRQAEESGPRFTKDRPVFQGTEKGNGCVGASSDAGDLRGGGYLFHPGAGGSAGPRSESPLQGRHAGELRDGDLARSSTNAPCTLIRTHFTFCTGFPIPKPELIARLERGEELWVSDLQDFKDRRLRRCTSTEVKVMP
ncbi:uncharacterized protein LOC119567577 isoform X2 [Chelonia mydas]|uniref:uncharacterized protein LOC119567577 isoform X2 n=1 Tax=Chelonia mydas TaxID=8469 RepID=UPI001CAA2FAB|nr:uncharacterized protein LOC119567577 isoform X2 [Chelonia mydas]